MTAKKQQDAAPEEPTTGYEPLYDRDQLVAESVMIFGQSPEVVGHALAPGTYTIGEAQAAIDAWLNAPALREV